MQTHQIILLEYNYLMTPRYQIFMIMHDYPLITLEKKKKTSKTKSCTLISHEQTSIFTLTIWSRSAQVACKISQLKTRMHINFKRTGATPLFCLQQSVSSGNRARKPHIYTPIKTFIKLIIPATGLITWSAFLSGECACANRCLIRGRGVGWRGGNANLSHCKQVQEPQ